MYRHKNNFHQGFKKRSYGTQNPKTPEKTSKYHCNGMGVKFGVESYRQDGFCVRTLPAGEGKQGTCLNERRTRPHSPSGHRLWQKDRVILCFGHACSPTAPYQSSNTPHSPQEQQEPGESVQVNWEIKQHPPAGSQSSAIKRKAQVREALLHL